MRILNWSVSHVFTRCTLAYKRRLIPIVFMVQQHNWVISIWTYKWTCAYHCNRSNSSYVWMSWCHIWQIWWPFDVPLSTWTMCCTDLTNSATAHSIHAYQHIVNWHLCKLKIINARISCRWQTARRTASRRTCCKQVTRSVSVIDKLATELSWQRFVSKVANFQLPQLHLTYPTCIWRIRWGWSRLSFAEIFGVRKLGSLGHDVALFAWSYV